MPCRFPARTAIFAFLLAAAIGVAGCPGTPIDGPRPEGEQSLRDYWPIAEGNSWSYGFPTRLFGANSPILARVSIASAFSVNGVVVYEAVLETFGEEPQTDRIFYLYLDGLLYSAPDEEALETLPDTDGLTLLEAEVFTAGVRMPHPLASEEGFEDRQYSTGILNDFMPVRFEVETDDRTVTLSYQFRDFPVPPVTHTLVQTVTLPGGGAGVLRFLCLDTGPMLVGPAVLRSASVDGQTVKTLPLKAGPAGWEIADADAAIAGIRAGLGFPER